MFVIAKIKIVIVLFWVIKIVLSSIYQQDWNVENQPMQKLLAFEIILSMADVDVAGGAALVLDNLVGIKLK